MKFGRPKCYLTLLKTAVNFPNISASSAGISILGGGDSYGYASWITTPPSIAGTPIGTIPMGLVDELPMGIGVVAARNDENGLVAAMGIIE